MASFYTEQMSADVREGIVRRVKEGWFRGPAPYGYHNVRKDGRGVIETDPQESANVKRMFHLYAYENLTLDGVVEKINSESRVYRPSMRKPFDVLVEGRFPKESGEGGIRTRGAV